MSVSRTESQGAEAFPISCVRNFSLQMSALIEHSPCYFVALLMAFLDYVRSVQTSVSKRRTLDIGNASAPWLSCFVGWM